MVRPADTARREVLPLSSDLELRRRFMVVDAPIRGNLRFGRLLEALDKLAEETALAHARRADPGARVVTAAIDNIRVRHPADVNRDLVLKASVNFVGRTSIVVGIRVEHDADGADHIASCYFTMVARPGEEGAKAPPVLSPLEYEDELERARRDKAVRNRERFREQRSAALDPPSPEEYALLAGLHAAHDEADFDQLLVSDLTASSWERTYPEQENVPRKIFGGVLVRKAYELAAINAESVTPDRPVVVAVNRINFFRPVRMGDKLHFLSRVVYTGRTSVCVEVNIERISLDRTVKALSNACLFTFVNVDADLVPQPVPAVYPTTYAEDARYLAAFRRNMAHLKFKKGIRGR
ncbi:MAG: hotdog domain-containing protein [Acidobacteriota bacterium]